MTKIRDLGWWYWLLTGGLLGAGLLGWPAGIYLALALCAVQFVHVFRITGDVTSFPVQVRAAYVLMLFAGLWGPLQWIHWMQLAGTSVRLLVGYCMLARTLSLAPWNRRLPLTGSLITRTFLSMQTALPPCGEAFRRISLERVPI
jgi:hypothetical protein